MNRQKQVESGVRLTQGTEGCRGKQAYGGRSFPVRGALKLECESSWPLENGVFLQHEGGCVQVSLRQTQKSNYLLLSLLS